MPILECRELSKRFGRTQALDHISLNVEAGRVVGLLGPNGSGKTTLIKLANGLLTPSEGEILIDGQAPGTYSKGVSPRVDERRTADGPLCRLLPGL